MGDFVAAKRARGKKQLWTWWVLPLAIIGGWFYPLLGFFLIFCMMAGVGIAVFKGRYWCNWMCPRGSSWDLFLKEVSLRKAIPRFFRSIHFRLLWLGILMGVMVWRLPSAWPDVNQMGQVFVMMLTVTTAVGILFGIPTRERSWCTYCPVGTMGNWLGRGRYPLTVSSNCHQCDNCLPVCPMEIKKSSFRPVEGTALVKDWDCLKCGLCVEVCPKEALRFNR